MKSMTRLRLLVLIVSMIGISIGSMGYLVYSSQSIVERDIPQVTILKEAISDIQEGHLWLEEFLSGDRGVNTYGIETRFENAKQKIGLLLEGGQTELASVAPLQDRYLRLTTQQISDLADILLILAYERMQQQLSRGVGSAMDSQFDQHYSEFKALGDHLVVQMSNQLKQKTLAHTEISVVLMIIALGGGVFSYWLVATYSSILLRKDKDISAKFEALKVSHEISYFAFQAGSLDQVLQGILQQVLSLGQYQNLNKGAIFLAEPGKDVLRIAAHVNFEDSILQRCKALQKGECHCGKVWQTGKPLNLHEHTGSDQEPHGHYIVPIRYGDQNLGVLSLYTAVGHKEGDQQHELMETIANTIAGVIIRKRYEEELVSAKIEAELGREVKTRLIQTMSHELRTPLNGILGSADLLLQMRRMDLDREDYDRFLQDIAASAERLLKTVNAVLDISAIDSGKMTLHEENLNVYALYATLMALLKEQIEEKGLHFQADIPQDLPFLRGDEQRIGQVLYNLLVNAINYTAPGGTIECQWRVGRDSALAVTIKDTGLGMTEEEIHIALDRFSQVDMSMTRKEEGIGLGLPLAKQIVELHGGMLTIDSTPGQGTAVTIHFPPERSRFSKAA